ncbi:cytochrome c [Geminicoccaceae bacterium 1502E]|nr:cytochrome c [Geminicoccaceae bacterium 1502E]
MAVRMLAAALGVAGLLWNAGVDAAAGDEDLLARGEHLFQIGGCTNCHTAKGGPLLAGGDAIKSPYGDFFAPNITPDPDQGIGGWSEEDFIRAMQEGRAPDGSAYYPAFPYTSYTRMGEDDLRALKAWLDTVPPVAQASREHGLGFPFNQRWAMRLWQWAFFEPGRFVPDPQKDELWNRGAYLSLGPGHCAECHTPRNFAGALIWDEAFAGAVLPGNEKVPNISGDLEHGLGTWSAGDVRTVLQLGMTPEGDFVGSEMAKIVSNGTGKLPPEDVRAIAAYIKSLPPR